MKITFFSWLKLMFKEFNKERKNKSAYEIVEIYECQKTGLNKAVIKLSGRHVVEKNISEIVIDMEILEILDKKTIRTLTYMATIESMKPDYTLVSQRLGDEVDDYILELKCKNRKTFTRKLDEIVKDKVLIRKLSPDDANKVGYLLGVKETVQEYKILSNKVI